MNAWGESWGVSWGAAWGGDDAPGVLLVDGLQFTAPGARLHLTPESAPLHAAASGRIHCAHHVASAHYTRETGRIHYDG